MKIILFTASWCPQCSQLKNHYPQHTEWEIVQADKEMEKCQKYDVFSLPTIILEKDGKILKRTTGFNIKEIDEFLKDKK